ncbi:MAG: carbohydrate-binding domain-containing protein, partial [candidate division KSB1 bacterium]|nr:carbohydrate-binding domain-containing protein [candidate division KSB1 bacterium]
MRKRKIILLGTCALILLMPLACEKATKPIAPTDENVSDGSGNTVVSHSGGYSEALAKAMAENSWHHEEADDYAWDNSQVTQISLNINSITVNGAGATVTDRRVVISLAGTYSLNGTLTDGQIIVNTEDKGVVRLILNGVNISNSTSAPINIQAAKKVIIILASGTENVVTDGASYIFDTPNQDEPNAAIFSKADLTIYGSGSLTVKGNYNDGIASKDGLIIAGGSEKITSVDDGRPKTADASVSLNVTAKDDGIRGKDYVVIRDAKITVKAGGDGLKSDNATDATRGYIWIQSGGINIASGKDAITAETDALISDGTFNLTCGGGSNSSVPIGTSAKGIKGLVLTIIAGGNFTIDAADDAIHSNDAVIIDNGTFAITTKDAAIHADRIATINAGTLNISKSYEGIEAAAITINDGYLNMVTSDDGFNATKGKRTEANDGSSLMINGGFIAVNSSRGDGLDSNGNASISGGTVIVHGPQSQPEVAFDINGTFNVSGGLFIATGPNSGFMIEVPSNSS